MTSDELRKLADEATQKGWEFKDLDLDGDHWPVVRTPENAWIAQGEGCFTPDVEEANLRLIGALGPDAARLLADAMDALQTASDCCARPYGVCCEWIELQDRFDALGVSS